MASSKLAASAPGKNFQPLRRSRRVAGLPPSSPAAPKTGSPPPLLDPSPITCVAVDPIPSIQAPSVPDTDTGTGSEPGTAIMAPTATIVQSDSAGGSATATMQPQLIGVSAKSKLQLAKPLTAKARRIISNKTNKLVKKRNEVDAWLLAEANRTTPLKPTDYLPREHYIKLDDALARREARHLRTRTKALEERERLYKWDPSTERKIDVDILTDHLFKFKRHLGSYLADRERPLKAGERDDDASSVGSDASPAGSGASSAGSEDDSDDSDDSDEEADGPVGNSKSSADPVEAATSDSDSSSDNSSDEDGSDDGSTDGDKNQSGINMDGAFDEHVQSQKKSKKRKVVNGQTDLTAEQGQRKKVKKAQKEQGTTNNNTTTLGSQSLQSKKIGNIGKQASIDSMPQSKKLPKIRINGESSNHNSEQDDDNDDNDDDAAKDAPDNKTTDSTTTKPPPADANVPTPWYKVHAKRSLEDDFDDCVYDIPPNSRRYKRRQQPKKQPKWKTNGPDYEEIPEFMSGALMTPAHARVRGDLPTPSTSSAPPSPQGSAADSKSKTARKPSTGPVRNNKLNQRRPSSLSSSIPHKKARLAKASTQRTGD